MSHISISKDQALSLLKRDIKVFENSVNSCLIRQVTQNQFDALVSLTYNIGPGNFKKSTLLKHVNANTVSEKDFLKWSSSGGKVLSGLVRRRKAEYKLYTT